MPCLLVILAYFVPRLLMFFIFLLTDWFGRAFETWYWPLLGFVFMPYTTLAYMAAMLVGGGVTNGWIVLLVVAVIFDLGAHGSTTRRRRR